MFDYVSGEVRAGDRRHRGGSDRWLNGDKNARRPPELLTRDVVARAPSAPRSRPAAAHRTAASFLDIASRQPADFIKRKLPSMYHQFKELAEVDITKEPMEVGPTLHYFMGGIRVDADTQMTTRAGAVRRRRVRRRPARRQPPRRQLAVRPDRVRQARRRRRGGVRRAVWLERRQPTPTPGRRARSARATEILNREQGREPVPPARGARGRDGARASASSATKTSSRRRSTSSRRSRREAQTSRRRAPASTTRAGTRRCRCARC